MYRHSYIACNRVLLYYDFALYRDKASLDRNRGLLLLFCVSDQQSKRELAGVYAEN